MGFLVRVEMSLGVWGFIGLGDVGFGVNLNFSARSVSESASILPNLHEIGFKI